MQMHKGQLPSKSSRVSKGCERVKFTLHYISESNYRKTKNEARQRQGGTKQKTTCIRKTIENICKEKDLQNNIWQIASAYYYVIGEFTKYFLPM